MGSLHVHDSPTALYQAVAQRWVDSVNGSIAARGVAHVALAGGSTPQRLYQRLAEAQMQHQLDWSRVHLYFGDERAVPADHPDSNYRMARLALIDHVPIPTDQVHPIHAAADTIQQDAAQYEATLREQVPLFQGQPRLDLVLLGMGNDGHTASLFPGTDILAEREKSVAAVYVPPMETWRISLTYPALENARALWLLVTGAGKTDIMQQVFHEPGAGLPVQRLANLEQTEWHLDQAAATNITHD